MWGLLDDGLAQREELIALVVGAQSAVIAPGFLQTPKAWICFVAGCVPRLRDKCYTLKETMELFERRHQRKA